MSAKPKPEEIVFQKPKDSYNIELSAKRLVADIQDTIAVINAPTPIGDLFKSEEEKEAERKELEEKQKLAAQAVLKTTKKEVAETWVPARMIVSSAKAFQGLIEGLKALIDHGTLVVSPDGIYLREMDPIKVAMVTMRIPKENFEEYNAYEEFRLGMDFDKLLAVLKKAESDDSLELFTKKEEPQKYYVRLRGKTIATFRLDSSDYGNEELSAPKIEHTASVKLTSESFKQAIKRCGVVSDQAKFKTDEKDRVFRMESTGDDGDAVVEYRSTDEGMLSFEVKEDASGIYPLKYLSDFMEMPKHGNFEAVELSFSLNMPLRVAFSGGGGDIVYWLAPRRETE
jgi:proliferating cell nuclear antigen